MPEDRDDGDDGDSRAEAPGSRVLVRLIARGGFVAVDDPVGDPRGEQSITRAQAIEVLEAARHARASAAIRVGVEGRGKRPFVSGKAAVEHAEALMDERPSGDDRPVSLHTFSDPAGGPTGAVQSFARRLAKLGADRLPGEGWRDPEPVAPAGGGRRSRSS